MYQDESTKVSIVSGSRFAAPPHFGQRTFMNPGWRASGDSPWGWKSTSSGRTTGSSSSGTGTRPDGARRPLRGGDRADPPPLVFRQPQGPKKMGPGVRPGLLPGGGGDAR